MLPSCLSTLQLEFEDFAVNLAWAALTKQLLFMVMKKKTSWVSTNCFRLKLEIPVETGMFYHQNMLSGNVLLGGNGKGFCRSLEACLPALPIVMRLSAPLAQEIPHPDPRLCFLMESWLVLQGGI